MKYDSVLYRVTASFPAGYAEFFVCACNHGRARKVVALKVVEVCSDLPQNVRAQNAFGRKLIKHGTAHTFAGSVNQIGAGLKGAFKAAFGNDIRVEAKRVK